MSSGPLISVGIPVYNGARTLRRAIESVLSQTEANLELVISDNASTDGTRDLCAGIARADPRVRYTCQAHNVGPLENYRGVLRSARGELFMWLGHDDWLDPDYLRRCASELQGNPGVALVGGAPRYYREGQRVAQGRIVRVGQSDPRERVVSYLKQVDDNGIFYGLMRRADVASITFPTCLAGDWMLVASLAYLGRVVTLDDVSVHRELGGTTRSYERIVMTLGLPRWNIRLPFTAMTLAAFDYFMRDAEVVRHLSASKRLRLATDAASVIAYRGTRAEAGRRLRRLLVGIRG